MIRSAIRSLARAGKQPSRLTPATPGTPGETDSGAITSKPLDRALVATAYLQGSGIEIGALHRPLAVPPTVHVRYVDRMPVADLRRHYPELSSLPLVPVDIIDDGETLSSIDDRSQDFVIANHFLEHCQNPILAVDTMLRVLKSGGVLYLAVPDKRYTFDRERPVTSLEHFERDYEEGPEWSRREHYEEWARLVEGAQPGDVAARADQLLAMHYSIHFHVWTQTEFLALINLLKRRLHHSFDIEVFLKRDEECICVIRKA